MVGELVPLGDVSWQDVSCQVAIAAAGEVASTPLDLRNPSIGGSEIPSMRSKRSQCTNAHILRWFFGQSW